MNDKIKLSQNLYTIKYKSLDYYEIYDKKNDIGFNPYLNDKSYNEAEDWYFDDHIKAKDDEHLDLYVDLKINENIFNCKGFFIDKRNNIAKRSIICLNYNEDLCSYLSHYIKNIDDYKSISTLKIEINIYNKLHKIKDRLNELFDM